MSADSQQIELAKLTLSVGVPFVIHDLQKQGGPNDYQLDAAHHYIEQQRLGEAIMFATKNETRHQMRLLIEICAILAFCPGGVNVCGLHFESEASHA